KLWTPEARRSPRSAWRRPSSRPRPRPTPRRGCTPNAARVARGPPAKNVSEGGVRRIEAAVGAATLAAFLGRDGPAPRLWPFFETLSHTLTCRARYPVGTLRVQGRSR